MSSFPLHRASLSRAAVAGRADLSPSGRALLSAPVGLILRGLIGGYRLLISPLLLPSCRFEPSCSHYAEEAIATHGPWRGTLLTVTRLLRCHPWGGHGYDPVPPSDP